MASDTKVATVFLGVALLIGWGAFAFGVASVASSQWRTDVTGQILTQARIYVNASFGLWSVCEEADCLSTSSITADPHLVATRAFMIAFVILCGFANLLNILSYFKCSRTARKISGVTYIIAGTCALIGAAVYTALAPPGQNGVGLAFAWLVMVLSFLAGLFAILSTSNMSTK